MLLKKYCMIRHLQLLIIHSMMHLKKKSPQWSTAFLRKSRETITHTGTWIISEDHQLTKKLHKSITKKSWKRKIYSSFGDNVWVTDLAGMQLISQYNKNSCYGLLILMSNLHGLLRWRIKKVLQSPMHFKMFWMNLLVNQTRYR